MAGQCSVNDGSCWKYILAKISSILIELFFTQEQLSNALSNTISIQFSIWYVSSEVYKYRTRHISLPNTYAMCKSKNRY